MNDGALVKYQRKSFWISIGVAVVLHIVVVALLVFIVQIETKPGFKPLAVMDFAYYDPEGGTGGGSFEEPAPVAEPEPPPPEPEVIEPEIVDIPNVITTTALDAAEAQVAPKVEEKIKPKPKPKPRPKPKPKRPRQVREQKSGIGGEGSNLTATKPGGGAGDGKGGIGGGTGRGNPNLDNAYKSKIRAKLIRLRKYPPSAQAQRLRGVVTVRFTVNRQGVVTSSQMARSSGHAVFDQEAMALLRRCSPFPAMPAKMERNSMTLTVPIDFRRPGRR